MAAAFSLEPPNQDSASASKSDKLLARVKAKSSSPNAVNPPPAFLPSSPPRHSPQQPHLRIADASVRIFAMH